MTSSYVLGYDNGVTLIYITSNIHQILHILHCTFPIWCMLWRNEVRQCILALFFYQSGRTQCCHHSSGEKKTDEHRINAPEMWLYGKLLGVSWRKKRTSESILSELGVERQLLSLVVKAEKGYYGCNARGSGSSLALLTTEGKVKRKHHGGRQSQKWYNTIKE